jgi:hypothetical protein
MTIRPPTCIPLVWRHTIELTYCCSCLNRRHPGATRQRLQRPSRARQPGCDRRSPGRAAYPRRWRAMSPCTCGSETGGRPGVAGHPATGCPLPGRPGRGPQRSNIHQLPREPAQAREPETMDVVAERLVVATSSYSLVCATARCDPTPPRRASGLVSLLSRRPRRSLADAQYGVRSPWLMFPDRDGDPRLAPADPVTRAATPVAPAAAPISSGPGATD